MFCIVIDVGEGNVCVFMCKYFSGGFFNFVGVVGDDGDFVFKMFSYLFVL